MTKEEVEAAKVIIQIDRATCEHTLALADTFRCPQCRGILRRCCNSILSHPHVEGCRWAR